MAIATAAAVGIGISAVSAGMSFAQASKQKKLQRQAQADAQKAMDQARKRLEPNYYAALSVQKEPHELAREALNVQGAQAIQAGVESERGAAATAGRVQAQMNTAQQEERNDYGKELTDLAKLTAGEDSRLRDVNVQLDLEEVAGQQQMAADAQQAATASTEQGIASATSALQQGIAAAPLYGKNKAAYNQIRAEKYYSSGANKTTPVITPISTGRLPSGLPTSAPPMQQATYNANPNPYMRVPQTPLTYQNQQNQNPYMQYGGYGQFFNPGIGG